MTKVPKAQLRETLKLSFVVRLQSALARVNCSWKITLNWSLVTPADSLLPCFSDGRNTLGWSQVTSWRYQKCRVLVSLTIYFECPAYCFYYVSVLLSINYFYLQILHYNGLFVIWAYFSSQLSSLKGECTSTGWGKEWSGDSVLEPMCFPGWNIWPVVFMGS